MNNETIKQVLVSIFIGACIAFLSTLFQGLLNWLQHLDISPAAIVAGMTYHLSTWKSNQVV